MADDLILRSYEPQDRDAVRGLLREAFGSADGFDRFEEDNPLGPPLRVVAEVGGRVVGFNHWNPWMVPTEDAEIPTFQSGASVVHRSMRGRGVFAKLLAKGEELALKRGVSVFLGFPNPASFDSFIRAGWDHIADMPLRVHLTPARGRGTTDAELDDDQRPAHRNAFWSWRYSRAGVEHRQVPGREGEPRDVYYRRMMLHGMPILKLMDVLTPAGRRRPEDFLAVSPHVPGPRLVLLRCSPDPRLRSLLLPRVPRSWSTPVVAKILSGDPDCLPRLRRACFVYGDIDAA